jgi:hypothetical protein
MNSGFSESEEEFPEESSRAYLNADHLPQALLRLDELIEKTGDVEKLRAGLGMRLALSMARELREHKDLGSDTGELVAGWTERFGQADVEAAIGIAREFLTRPDQLAKEFSERLNSLHPQPRVEREE